MILFFVGIIEMAIATYWTRSVANANVKLNGIITGVNFAIWYFVIRQIVDNIDNWQAIVPYGAGCVAGSMLGVAFDTDLLIKKATRWFARMKKGRPAVRGKIMGAPRTEARVPLAIDYDHP